MERHYYSNTIRNFLKDSVHEILGALSRNSGFAVDPTQIQAWLDQIEILKACLAGRTGRIFFEYSIPRMGRRVDVILIIANVIPVLEFKVGETNFLPSAIDQVWDYALDLKNFHETSHTPIVVPLLVATAATRGWSEHSFAIDVDGLLSPPLRTNTNRLAETIDAVLQFAKTDQIDSEAWEAGSYSPTPTIIEAATTLYRKHSVYAITRKDASAAKLRETTDAVFEIIEHSRNACQKAICFITGVPGAGKTLIGLEIATRYLDASGTDRSVFLSGNDPLVKILTEALARDTVERAKLAGGRKRIGEARGEIRAFIQNVHNYRDLYLIDKKAPIDHVAIFDEAQRAWNLAETASFMRRKKGIPNFKMSEPQFLISCLDRHKDWAVIICLVGGGQEINRGEAGIGEWIESLNRSFPKWNIYISDRLHDAEYAAGEVLKQIEHKEHVSIDDRLHLSVSMRSYRAENVSGFVKAVLDLEIKTAFELYTKIRDKYPMVLTRDLGAAKQWLREKARGTERFGLLASSSAERLKAKCIDVKSPMNPVNWFLEGKDDVRSSYFLEAVATEFQVQGLELDWACIAWDADFRHLPNDWGTFSFRGNKWDKVLAPERKQYLKNAYRVLLTRARQGMIIVVPEGNSDDATRKAEYYDGTFNYLRQIGLETI